MSLKLGDSAPDFASDTSTGRIDSFHSWIGDSWAILFSHPADYTPVCTTELSRVAELQAEFAKRNTKLVALSCDGVESHQGWIKFAKRNTQLVALSCDGVESHQAWIKDISAYGGAQVEYPIIADPDRLLAVKLGMLDADEKTKEGLPLTARAVFIFGPDKRLKLSLLYPATTGRNFDELLRVLDSLQLTAVKKVATPVDWKAGGDCMVIPTLSADEAKKEFPNHRQVEVPSGKPYLRFTECPK